MKYNQELYDLCKKFGVKYSPAKNRKRIDKLQRIVLKNIFEKTKDDLTEYNEKDGEIDICFFKEINGVKISGYEEIIELIERGNFNSFASEYCIYLKNFKEYEDRYSEAYIELTWEYQNYFNIMTEEKAFQRRLENKGGNN